MISSAVTSLTGQVPGSEQTAGRVASNPSGLGKDDFLKLLVAQLSNQSPLNPMDSTAFVAQLAQFSSLEQLAQVNQGLHTLTVGQAGILAGQSIQLVGKTIVYPGNRIGLDGNGPVTLRYELGGNSESATLRMRDASGDVVRTVDLGTPTSGQHEFIWDGTNDDGDAVPSGSYRMEVEAKGPDGNEVHSRTFGTGTVTGITFEKGFPQLMVGDIRVQPSDILKVLGSQAPSQNPR